jgi:hypothetical protein
VAGPSAFRILVYNVLIGNQIVIRGEESTVVVSALSVVQQLLPLECCEMVRFSSEYIDSYQARFLGMPLDADVPDYVDEESFALIGTASVGFFH